MSRARTFGVLHEIEALWAAGLARGGSLDNAILLDEGRVLNKDGLRWENEFVRHKILDLVGDMALLGMPIEGHISVECGGHALHRRLLEELLKAQDAWEICTADGLTVPGSNGELMQPASMPVGAMA